MFYKTDRTKWIQRKCVTDSHKQTKALRERFDFGEEKTPRKKRTTKKNRQEESCCLLNERQQHSLNRLSRHFPECTCCHMCQMLRARLLCDARFRLQLPLLHTTDLKLGVVYKHSSAMTGNTQGLCFSCCCPFPDFPLLALPTGFIRHRDRARRQILNRPRRKLNRTVFFSIPSVWQ